MVENKIYTIFLVLAELLKDLCAQFAPISDTKNDSEISQGEFGEGASCS